jgi:anhydro-N-acetylmuramic acid kinase
MMAHPFFALPPPKSTGREDFGAAYADAFLAQARGLGLSDADAVATATAFTSEGIADGLGRFVREPVGEVIVSGGGAHNETLMACLRARLPGVRVRRIEAVGGSTEAKEALAFAVLANETLAGGTGNVPRVTGASRPVVLGKVAPV